ncbi:MAG: 50S ribosomal protein L1 [Candidatus Goldiibacteriota bacterium HGW-Goldbacteria-1]|jgi:large subunit ribosomal protein L1|nr:MAG: 50S ribosomal protein L1 [Candidatus Goldiibacteriota bacterium HGW-Goldbacteria-1]
MGSKRHDAAVKLLEKSKVYEVEEAVKLLKQTANVKFDESIDIAVNLAKKPVQAEQQIRSTIVLPNGSGKKVKVIVFVKGDKQKEALAAGADEVGAEELIEKIKGGWLGFDIAIATPEMMKEVGKLGKILGTKGLMPNPKSGTVTLEVGKAVKEFKGGKVEYRNNKEGVVHVLAGKASFAENAIAENITAFLKVFLKLPALATKGQYVKSIYVSTTMGVGVPVNFKKFI